MSRYHHLLAAALIAAVYPVAASAEPALPTTTTDDFCAVVQKIVANTEIPSELTVYTDVGEFRGSKPAPRPLTNSQYVWYEDERPKMISCKVKAADHLIDEYGEGAAGPQGACRDITVLIVDQFIAGLESENAELAAAARDRFVVEPDEPYLTGGSYLSDFPLAFLGDDGRIHVNTQSLQINWEDWRFYIMPNRLRGQTYCHLIAPEHVAALFAGEAALDVADD